MSIKDLVFTEGNRVDLRNVENGCLIYDLINRWNVVLLTFSVPPEDQLGATFEKIDTPKLFMRWIRRELERRKDEQEMIDRARADWERELAEKDEEAKG